MVSPYGMVEENGYLRINPVTGEMTALSAEFDENKGNLYQPWFVLYLIDTTDSSNYQTVTSYKVSVRKKA